jgi:hypothetical protein
MSKWSGSVPKIAAGAYIHIQSNPSRDKVPLKHIIFKFQISFSKEEV